MATGGKRRVISAFVATVVLWEVPRRATPCSTGTAGQVALAWLLAQPYDIAPIPGSKRVAYVRENLGATATPLSVDDVALLADLFDHARVKGGRYGPRNAGP